MKKKVSSATIQNQRKIDEMAIKQEGIDNRVLQQVADRAMRAARREEYRNREQADNMVTTVSFRKDSANGTEDETKTRK